MKKIVVFLLLALLIASLVACARTETVYERTVNGETYLINTRNQTLTHEGAVYTYTITEKSSKEYIRFGLLRVQYPDGTWYEREIDDDGRLGLSYEKTSSNYDEKTYPRGEDLCYALEDVALETVDRGERAFSWENIEYKIIILGFFGIWGAFQIFLPETVCWIRHGRWVKDAEPTEEAIRATRFGGVFLIVVGICVLLFM